MDLRALLRHSRAGSRVTPPRRVGGIAVAVIVVGAVASAVTALGADGWWVIALVVTGVVTAAAWSIWTTVVRPARDAATDVLIDKRHASAVALTIHDRSLMVANCGSHEIRDIGIFAMASGGAMDEMLMGPRFEPSSARGVEVTSMPGNDFAVDIAQLAPTKGWSIGAFCRPDANETAHVQFDVSWLDHSGLRRTATGTTDVLTTAFTVVKLVSPSKISRVSGASA